MRPPGLADLMCSIYNQMDFFFEKSGFFKIFESAYGIAWGRQRQLQQVAFNIAAPGQPVPVQPPGQPVKSN